jgi:hypothetical protein
MDAVTLIMPKIASEDQVILDFVKTGLLIMKF